MSSFIFKRATREGAHVIVLLAGGTGSGKTYSALRLARGLAGESGKIAVIDTEAGRAKHYADAFAFDHGDLAAFRPADYLAAIEAAEAAGYDVIVVDSITHEHAAILDWHEEEWAKKDHRDAHKFTAWIAPKMAHKRMRDRLLQLRAHLILCARAEDKIDIAQGTGGGKTTVKTEWRAVVEKDLPFEALCSFLLHHEAPGFPARPTKLPEALRPMFAPDRPIDEDCGRRIAAWAAGGNAKTKPAPAPGPNGSAAATAKPIEERRADAVRRFAARGVPLATLENFLQAKQDAWTEAMLAKLPSAYKRIVAGENPAAVMRAEIPDDDWPKETQGEAP